MIDAPVLELVDATVVKNGTPILDRLTLTIRAGEHTAIVGPNGAGKSTLVSLLTRDDRAFARGEVSVRVFGKDRWDLFELRAQLGVVSASSHLQFISGNSAGQISGEAVVLSGFFATHGVIRSEKVTDAMRERVDRVFARVEAEPLRKKLMNEMSTGEARRVLIARALVTSPRALVLDEPTEGLDIVARHRFLRFVERIALDGTTLVVVTHHVEEIVPSIGRVVLMRTGRVAFDGAKDAMLTAPTLSAVFGAPISVTEIDGRYYARA